MGFLPIAVFGFWNYCNIFSNRTENYGKATGEGWDGRGVLRNFTFKMF